MPQKANREALMLTVIKCTNILLHIVLIGASTSLNEMEQCVLCAYCDPPYKGINESRKICTDPTKVPNLEENFEFECHRHGDFSELMYHNGTHTTSDISIIPPSTMCYFNISYYNISRASFVEDDTVFLAQGGYQNVTSVKRKWKVIDIPTHMTFQFRVLGLTGR